MKLSRSSLYALRAVCNLAKSKVSDPKPSHKIADEEGVPERFLLKVLKPLVSARILHSTKGPNGGYRLTKQPDEISLLAVLEAVDGPISGGSPEIGVTTPIDRKLNDMFETVAKNNRSYLNHINVGDLNKK